MGEDWNSESCPSCDEGKPVFAASTGRVVYAHDTGICSWKGVIIIRHEAPVGSSFSIPGGGTTGAVTTFYAHLDVNHINDWVVPNQEVVKGQQIGVIGPTPCGSTGPHLHLEVRTDASAVLGPGYSEAPRPTGWTDPSQFIAANRTGTRIFPLGIDVSEYQGTVNWSQVSNPGGKAFALIRATAGKNTTDDHFAQNVINARVAGLFFGAYHFAYPEYFTAHEEAQKFLSVAGAYIGAGYLPPALDIEDSGAEDSYPYRMGTAALSQWIRDWGSEVEQIAGIKPMVYTTRFYARNYLENNISQYPFWVVTDSGSPDSDPGDMGIWSTWKFQQYRYGESGGTCPGVSGPVDLDSFNGDLIALRALTDRVANQPPTANAQAVTTNEDTPVSITLTGSDPDGDDLTFTVVTQPSHGSLSGMPPKLIYSPAANFNGNDSFTFKVNDGTADSNIATVSITVNSSTASLKLAPTGPTTISPGDPMSFSLTVENPGAPLPIRFQLVLLPEFLGREISLVRPMNVTLPSGTVGPVPISLPLPPNIQSRFPGDYSFIGRLLDGSGSLLSESRANFTVPAKVSIRDFSFAPQLIEVRVGENVQWTNNGAVTHTTTSNAGGWDSRNLAPGVPWDHAFTSAGSFLYQCKIHPWMVGGVIVHSGPLSAALERAMAEKRLKKSLKGGKFEKLIRRRLRP